MGQHFMECMNCHVFYTIIKQTIKKLKSDSSTHAPLTKKSFKIVHKTYIVSYMPISRPQGMIKPTLLLQRLYKLVLLQQPNLVSPQT